MALVALAACAHNPLADPPPRDLDYEQAIDCAGLPSAVHMLGAPEGWTYDRRADMFALLAEELAPDRTIETVAPAVRASAVRHLVRFPNIRLN